MMASFRTAVPVPGAASQINVRNGCFQLCYRSDERRPDANICYVRDSEVTNVTAAPAIAPLAHDGSPLVVNCFVYQNPAKSGSFIKPPELQMI